MPDHELCIEQVEPWEAALLAGIIQDPTGYDPATHPMAAKERRDVVLRADVRAELSDEVASTNRASISRCPAPADIQAPEEQTVEGVNAGYFTSWVQQQVIERYGAPRAFAGGLKIKTTLDLGLQRAAEQSIDDYLAYSGDPSASLVAIENSTGEVRAMVGGRNYDESPFNLATEGERQPGSSFKAFDLAAALEDGISPDSEWPSKEKTFYVHGPHGIEKFVVHNDEGAYTGENTLTGAIAYSDNSIFAEVGLKVGTTRIADLAHRMGITTPISTNPAMTIGGLSIGVTPLDMAHAYETIAHGGQRVSGTLAEDDAPVGIQEVVSPSSPLPDGSHRDVNHVRTKPVLPPGVAATETEMLETVLRVRHRQSRRARRIRRRQDRHDLELRRRLVRRLEPQVHGRRLGRLPRRRETDAHRLRRRPRARRYLPRADLAQLHDLRAGNRKGTGRTRRRRLQARRRRRRREPVGHERHPGIHDAVEHGGSAETDHGADDGRRCG